MTYPLAHLGFGCPCHLTLKRHTLPLSGRHVLEAPLHLWRARLGLLPLEERSGLTSLGLFSVHLILNDFLWLDRECGGTRSLSCPVDGTNRVVACVLFKCFRDGERVHVRKCCDLWQKCTKMSQVSFHWIIKWCLLCLEKGKTQGDNNTTQFSFEKKKLAEKTHMKKGTKV